MNPVADFDFGVTALAQRFHQDWAREGKPLEVATAGLDELPDSHLAALTDDLSFMIEWSGRSEYVESLWLASTMGNYQPHLVGVSSKNLLSLVLTECNEKVDRKGLSPSSGALRYRAFEGDVQRAIGQVRARLADSIVRSGLGLPGELHPSAVNALQHYAQSEARPELAFRFLLRLLVASNCTIGLAEYESFQEIGAGMGYGAFLISTVDFLVE